MFNPNLSQPLGDSDPMTTVNQQVLIQKLHQDKLVLGQEVELWS